MSSPFKIVLFHPVHLPPKDYGGVERVVIWLASALRDLGHTVYVAALEGSRLPNGVTLIPMQSQARSAVDLVPKLPPGVDVVHFHAPPETDFFKLCAVPAVTTVHGNGRSDELFPGQTVFLSADHARRHGRKTFVHNGLDPAEFIFSPASEKSGAGKKAPLFLSKTSWKVKNLAGALRIANAAGEKLTIAGGHRPWTLRARALLGGHAWAGPVSGPKKAELLTRASALLFPVRWDEPFGLVLVEAMLSGTPVVGSKMGSVPEVVGSSGVVVDAPFWNAQSATAEKTALEKWVAALQAARKLDPESIRADALKRFSHRRMAEDYLRVYNQVIRGEKL